MRFFLRCSPIVFGSRLKSTGFNVFKDLEQNCKKATKSCRCGMADTPGHRCTRGERCKTDYQARLSGPLLDCIDMRIYVPAVSASDLIKPQKSECSKDVAKRVARARQIQAERFIGLGLSHINTNGQCPTSQIEKIAIMDEPSRQLLTQASEKFSFSARDYHRILKLGRTLADLDAQESISRAHMAEAIVQRMGSAIASL